MTEVRGNDGDYVQSGGPIDLHALTLSSASTVQRVQTALAVVLGGVGRTSAVKEKGTEQQSRVGHEVWQMCKSFVGSITQQRREWSRQQAKMVKAGNSILSALNEDGLQQERRDPLL